MPNLIDIRRRIRSVKSTQQITKAMKMVAASKLRRSQERVLAARPYARTLGATLASVAGRLPARDDGAPAHPLLAQREEKKVVLVVVTGDKGLCGAFNTNVNRVAAGFLREKRAAGVEVSLVTLGRKACDFWKRRSIPVLDARPGLFQRFGYDTAAEVARSLAARFTGEEADAVHVVYNEFRSVISQVVGQRRLLPIELDELETNEAGTDYLYEPGPDVILGRLLPRHVEFQLFRILLESNAAENAARMTAMESATKNAGEMIDSLTLTYNRARQAKITKELIEIVSGAEALK
ncbi:MAG TPA: ATP synthase F1 subunit gamma [Thermoanaerobaculia bacterium]|nr:ATP synthase F1 subunit gamma [Thermoanaerobaculia bacterium]HQP87828.1 ATP synthase F1 subunit gamma [Thermoanaerobaculia bacterium]